MNAPSGLFRFDMQEIVRSDRILRAFAHFRAARAINQGDHAGSVQSGADFGSGLAGRRRMNAAIRFEQQPLELKCDIFGGIEPQRYRAVAGARFLIGGAYSRSGRRFIGR